MRRPSLLWLAPRPCLPRVPAGFTFVELLVVVALITVLIGLLILVSRTLALTQVLGYIVLENGIFLFGTLLLEAMPFLVEIGALLDLFVGIFVMGIIINHINREFSSLDTARLSAA